MIVAIDGPVAAGKTSAARILAARLDALLLDTGAIYRSVALAATWAGVDWTAAAAVTRLAATLPLDFRSVDEVQQVWLGDTDVSAAIRRPDISQGASIVSAHPGVRQALLDLQRRQAGRGNLIAEGRDIGTVVFPGADHKFFIDAEVSIRARRRLLQLQESGSTTDFDSVLADLRERDERDTTRSIAPLVPASDAIQIDTSDLSLAQVTDRMLGLIGSRARGALA